MSGHPLPSVFEGDFEDTTRSTWALVAIFAVGVVALCAIAVISPRLAGEVYRRLP